MTLEPTSQIRPIDPERLERAESLLRELASS